MRSHNSIKAVSLYGRLIVVSTLLGTGLTISAAMTSALFVESPSSVERSDNWNGWDLSIVYAPGATRVHSHATIKTSSWQLAQKDWFDSDYCGPYIWALHSGARLPYAQETDQIDAPRWSRTSSHATGIEGGLIEDARGWPFRALLVRIDSKSYGFYSHVPPHARWGLVRGTVADMSMFMLSGDRTDWLLPTFLPLRPTMGFLWCTMFYATVCFVFTGGSRWIVRSRRARHNQCPACGYKTLTPSRGVCSECGSPLAALG